MPSGDSVGSHQALTAARAGPVGTGITVDASQVAASPIAGSLVGTTTISSYSQLWLFAGVLASLAEVR
jgi:hypothetical protein